MMPAVLPGDFIMANKWTYGARIFTNLEFDKHSDPEMRRMPGFGHIRRGDVLVFNFPYRSTWDTIRMNLNKIFVKRCVGMPNDSVSIVDGFYRLADLPDTLGNISGQELLVESRNYLAPEIWRTFPFDSIRFSWNVLNFGPLFVPAAGSTIPLTPGNFILYRKMMVYETGTSVRMEDSTVYINNNPTDTYTFNRNWYFIAGDHAVNSQDSRYIGLIPEDYIIGKASMVLSSKDIYSGKRRWDRIMKRIK